MNGVHYKLVTKLHGNSSEKLGHFVSGHLNSLSIGYSGTQRKEFKIIFKFKELSMK